MCIATSGKVCKTDKNTAKVDVLGNMLNIDTRLIKPSIGDYVLIHAGCAIEVINKRQSDELNEIYALLGEVNGEDRANN